MIRVISALEKKAANQSAKQAKAVAQQELAIADDWKVGSKDLSKKEIEEQKRLEKLAKKAEREALLEAEQETVNAKKQSLGMALGPGRRSGSNLELSSIEKFSASNVDDALEMLTLAASTADANTSDKLDRHPERRVKSAYAVFEVM